MFAIQFKLFGKLPLPSSKMTEIFQEWTNQKVEMGIDERVETFFSPRMRHHASSSADFLETGGDKECIIRLTQTANSSILSH